MHYMRDDPDTQDKGPICEPSESQGPPAEAIDWAFFTFLILLTFAL